jgi:hypothetical protein
MKRKSKSSTKDWPSKTKQTHTALPEGNQARNVSPPLDFGSPTRRRGKRTEPEKREGRLKGK